MNRFSRIQSRKSILNSNTHRILHFSVLKSGLDL